MLRNLISKLPVIANSTEHGVSSTCNVRNLRNVSPLRKRSNSISKCNGRSNTYSITAMPQVRRSLSLPRPPQGSLYEFLENKGLDEACRGFCQSRDFQDKQEKYATERIRERPVKKKTDSSDFEVGSTYYEPTEQYELEAAQPRPHREIRAGTDIEDLRKHEQRATEKRNETEAIQPANLKPFGSQDNLFFVSLFKPQSTIRYPKNEYPSNNDVNISDQPEPTPGANPNVSQYDNKSQHRKYSTTVQRLADHEIDQESPMIKISIPSKTSLNEKRKTQIEDYIYQRYKPQNKKNEQPTGKLIEIPSIEDEAGPSLNAFPVKAKRAVSEENFAKTFSGGLQQRRTFEPEKVPATRGLSGFSVSHSTSKSQTILTNAEKKIQSFKPLDFRKFAGYGRDDVCCSKKKKKVIKMPLEPEPCREPDPEHLKKVLLPSKVKLKVHPCLLRPNYDCPPKPKCPPRADDCKEFIFKPLPKMEPKDCECVPDIVLKDGPRLKRLNLKVDPPARGPCKPPPCTTPRADDNKPFKKKKLTVLEPKDCPCIEPPPMIDVKLARLGPCKIPEVCKPPRKCPPKKMCPPRADDGLEVCPKVLPFMEPKPCPCIEDPPLKDVKIRRLDLSIPEPKRICPPVKVCPPRADDNYVLKPKKLRHIEPGDCPCVDHEMTDVNFRRLKCKEIEYKCVVPDPCKVTPRADWGCWEYEQWECKEVDPECIEPPPCTTTRPCPDPCLKKNPCEHGTRDILKNSKREFNTDSRHSDTSLKMKLFRQLKSRTAKSDVTRSNKEEKSEGIKEEVKFKKAEANIPVSANADVVLEKASVVANAMLAKPGKNKKAEPKSSTPPTVRLIEKLGELERKKANPLLFNPIEKNKLSIDKIRLVTERMPTNSDFQSNSTLSVMSTRAMSTCNKGGIAKNKSGAAKMENGKKGDSSKKVESSKKASAANEKPLIAPKPMRVSQSAPGGSRGTCQDPVRHPCVRKAAPVKCSRQDAPYPSFAESMYGELIPFTNETRWRYDAVGDEHYSRIVKGTKPGSAGGRRPYSTRPPTAPIGNTYDGKEDNSGQTARRCKNPRSCSETAHKATKGKPPCGPVFKLENCPDMHRDSICSVLPWKAGPQPCEPKPQSPFPAFSEIITEDIKDTISVCPVDRKQHRSVQPANLEPLNRFALPQPIFPINDRVNHEMAKNCRDEYEERNDFQDECYAEREDLYVTEPPEKKKFSRAKRVTNHLLSVDRNKHQRKFSTSGSLYKIQTRSFSSVEYSTRLEEKYSNIDVHSKSTQDFSRRMYIRNYNMFCKNPDNFHEDIDERIKDLTEKHMSDPNSTCKFIKLKNVNWRVKNFRKFEKLSKFKNVPTNIKRFYQHSKSKYKVYSTGRNFCTAIKTVNSAVQDSNLESAIIREFSSNMSLSKEKKGMCDVHPEILQKIEGRKKFKLEMKKKFKKTESMIKLDQKPCCPAPEPKIQVANPNVQLDPDSQFSEHFSPCTKTLPCPKFRLSNCPEKIEGTCRTRPPRAHVPCKKQSSPYKSFAECNTGNIFPDSSTECPFLRENMKEILQPRYPILAENAYDFKHPSADPIDASFELDYIQRRLGVEKGVTQNCETFGSCLSLPRCCDFEQLMNETDCGKVERRLGEGCKPDFKIIPCGTTKDEIKQGGRNKGESSCKVGKGKCSAKQGQNSKGVSGPGSKNTLKFSACQLPNNVLGVTRDTQDDGLPDIPPEYQTSRYIKIDPPNDETNITQYNKNIQLREMTFQHDGQFIHPNPVLPPENDSKKDAKDEFNSINLAIVKTGANDCKLVFRFRPDNENLDQNVNVTPKFTSESKPISWFQHLKDFFYSSYKQDSKKYHGYLQVPTCMDENDKNSAICNLPKSLLKYKRRKEKRTGIIKTLYSDKNEEAGDNNGVRLCMTKSKDRMILCEPAEVCYEVKAHECPQDDSKQFSQVCSKIKPPECQKSTDNSEFCKMQPPECQTIRQQCSEVCCDIAPACLPSKQKTSDICYKTKPEVCCENTKPKTTMVCCDQNQPECAKKPVVCCEVKKPNCERKKSTVACRAEKNGPKQVKTYSETCIKIQQTKTEEVAPGISTTCVQQICLPKPKDECTVQCKSAPPPCSSTPPPCPPAPPTCPPPPPKCPPPPCTPEPKCEKDSLLTKIKNYFKARPNCPGPDEWKKKALQQKAEKAAHKAGLVVIDPCMLPPEIRECVCNGKLDIEMCKEVCDTDVPPACQKTPNCGEPKKSCCSGGSSQYNKNQPISCCNRSDFGIRSQKRKISTMLVQTRFYSRNFTRRNLDEINRILEEEEFKKKRKWFDDIYESSNREPRYHELSVRNLENRHNDDQFSDEDYKNYLFSKKHRINSNGRLVKNNDAGICYMNEASYGIPSRENILQKVLHINMSDFRAKMRMDLYNLVEENVESTKSLSVEEWEYLKTQDVLRALDALLKKKISEED